MTPDPTVGQIFVLFIMGLAAAEIAITLSIIIAVYRNYRSIHSKELSELNGLVHGNALRSPAPARRPRPARRCRLVMATGKKPNLREACSFLAAATLFLVVVSMIPCVRAGHTLHFTLFQLLPGLSFALRADALSMIFAVTASFLWVLTVFYSAGYMRSLGEHAQTRFSTCFALALFGAIGCAFSDNLLTLYLFYEIVSITTYPLVAHHQDEEGYEGGRKYLIYLTTAAKG